MGNQLVCSTTVHSITLNLTHPSSSTAENGLGITAAALATLRPLFRSFLSASKTRSNGQNSESGCLKFGNGTRQRDNAGYVRNREGDLEHGVELSTIQKKILKTEDGTLQVVEHPVLQRSPSQLALRVASPAWLAPGDRKSPRGLIELQSYPSRTG